MMKNKNIDQLFQEKMEGMEITPNPEVWSAIEGKLKKKKRRVLPYWWLSGSVAAILILGLFILPGNPSDPSDFVNPEDPTLTILPEDKINIKNDSNKQILKFLPEQKSILVAKTPTQKKKTTQKEKVRNTDTSWKDKTVIADNTVNSEVRNTEKNNTVIKNDKKQQPAFVIPEKPSKEKRKSIFDRKPSEKMLFAEHRKDSTQEKNPLAKKKTDFIAFINAKDSVKKEPFNPKKWAVSSVFAVLNSNSFTNSSPIAADLQASPTRGTNTFSYGAKVDYRVSKKWSIRTGAHLQEMSYLTQDVSITAGAARANSGNIDFGSTARSYFFSYSLVDIDNVMSNLTPIASLGATNINNGEISQSFSYIEIPFEVKYHVTSGEKLKTGIVAGFSSLFLVDNSIEIAMGGTPSVFGRANNLNSLNFSGNIGFDIDYAINKHWALNLNPMFKSQLNTFSNNANGFRPYFIGVYSGIRYQF